MDLWWKFAGSSRVRMVCADPHRCLQSLAEKYCLEDIVWISDLELEFSVSRRDGQQVLAQIRKSGNKGELLSTSGTALKLKGWIRQPFLASILALILAATLWLPTRILFIRVEGNEMVSTRKILEAAAESGVAFGASRKSLRSEQVKNHLLETIPQLSWVGVNTGGCAATITVQERSIQQETAKTEYGSIVAARDAVVTEIVYTSGEVVCTVGQAVRAGQVLISGYKDLGICTRVVAAQGEIYGLTNREIRAVLPEMTHQRTEVWESTTRYSVIFGKKRINFYANSGILDTTCGKMRMVYQACLPGGWLLPVCFVAETYEAANLTQVLRTEEDTESLLVEEARRYLNRQMVAGEILQSESVLTVGDGAYLLSGTYQCRELIGRRSGTVFLEGD